MANLGHDVTMVTSGAKNKRYYEGNVRVVQVGEVEALSKKYKIFNPLYVFRRISYMLKAAQYILENSFDIVESADGGFEHLFLLFFRRSPLVVRLHGTVAFRSSVRLPGFVSWFVKFFERFCLLKSDGIIAPTRSYWKYSRNLYKISHRKVSVIPNGIHMNRSCMAVDVRQKYNLQNRKIVLYCATLEWRKGFDILLRLAERFRYRNDLAFVVLGKMNSKYDCLEESKSILYLGHRPSDEVFAFYQACDLFFTPSRLEAGPLNVIEAIACGKHILGSNAVGVKDEIEDGRNGLLFDINDENDLFSKFERMIDAPELLERFSNESLSLKSKYEIYHIAKLMEVFYQEIILEWTRR